MKKKNNKKIILDLCGGTGSWSKPYKDAGYDVRLITIPNYDINQTVIERNSIEFRGKKIMRVAKDEVYGVLAAPPCTMFSFARTNAKTPRDLKEGMKCVRSCLDIIWSLMEVKQETGKKTLPLQFWALENPYHGFLKKFLSEPKFVFDPYDFGDPYQKRTALWGHFNEPKKNPVKLTAGQKAKAKTNSTLHTLGTKFDYLKSKDIHPEHFGKLDRQARRSITPQGFAQAFYKANP